MKCSTLSLLMIASAVSACATLRVKQPTPQASVWVCHGGRNPKWQRVSAAAADAHRRHGDQVTESPRQKGKRCG